MGTWLLVPNGWGQQSVNTNYTAVQMVDELTGGTLSASNETIRCDNNYYGSFNDPISNLGIDQGVFLSTGEVTTGSLFQANNNEFTASGNVPATLGDPDLENINNDPIENVCVLEFDFVATCDSFSIDYVFGSEEYNTYVCSDFNDKFGFFLDGPNPAGGTYNKENLAVLPNGTVVSINTVNNGQKSGSGGVVCDQTNAAYFVDNTNGGSQVAINGYTVPLTAKARVTPGQTYHIKLAVGNVLDANYDSGVFFSKNGVTCSSAPNTFTLTADNDAIENCENGQFTITRSPSGSTDTDVVQLNFGGSATSGTDYTTPPTSVTFNPGQDVATIDIDALADGITEGNETVSLTISYQGTDVDTKSIDISDEFSIDLGADQSSCSSVNIGIPNESGVTYQWSDASGNIAGATNSTYTASTSGNYTLQATKGTCVATSSVNVTIGSSVTIDLGNDFSACVDTVFTASGFPSGSTLQWFRNNNPLSGETNASLNISQSGTYKLEVTSSGGCSGEDEVMVTINPLPNVNAGTDLAICEGESQNLAGTGATSYSWSPATGLSNANIANPTANPTATTTYTLTGTDANGCVNTDQITVTVNALPNVDAGADFSICGGSGQAMSPSGATSYSWSPTTGLSNANIANPTANPTTTTTYTLTGTDANGCVNTDQITVSVNALASVDAGTDFAICEGESQNLAGTGATTYSWSPATGLSDANIANPTANPTTTTTYTLTGTDANGCQNTDQITVTVNNLPNVDAGTDFAICTGDSQNMAGTGATSYSWAPATGLSNANIANPSANPTATTTYTLTGTDANGCVNTDQITVTVNALPSVDAGTDFALCTGDAQNLAGTGATSYSWAPATGLSNANIANPSANPTATTTYTLTGTDANGCVNTDQITVTVNDLPSVDAGTDFAICTGDAQNLTGTGATSYSWSPTTGLSSANIANPSANPTATTTYTLTGTDANGCVNTDQITVTVNALPSVDAGPDFALCTGDSQNMQGSGATSYVWSPTNGLSNTNINNPTAPANPTVTTTYTLTGTDANGCVNSDQITVTVNELPNVSAGTDFDICKSDSQQLNGSGAQTYVWSPATDLSDANIANPNFTAVSDRTYTLTGTDANGCVNTAQLSIGVLVNPVPSVSIQSTAPACIGSTIDFSIQNETNLGTSPQFEWFRIDTNGQTTSIGTQPTVSLNNLADGEEVYLVATSSFECALPKTAESAKEKVTIYDYPNLVLSEDMLVCRGVPDTLMVEDQNNLVSTFEWYQNGKLISGATAGTLVRSQMQHAGDYQVKANYQGCASSSNNVKVSLLALNIELEATDTLVMRNSEISITAMTNASQVNWVSTNNGSWSGFVIDDQPNATTIYYATASDSICIAQDTIKVRVVDPFSIPRSFTPNGDADNDTWEIANIQDYPQYSIQVFNRWGVPVAEWYNNYQPWDGVSKNGQILPEGTYFYTIRVGTESLNVTPFTGNVTIIR